MLSQSILLVMIFPQEAKSRSRSAEKNVEIFIYFNISLYILYKISWKYHPNAYRARLLKKFRINWNLQV